MCYRSDRITDSNLASHIAPASFLLFTALMQMKSPAGVVVAYDPAGQVTSMTTPQRPINIGSLNAKKAKQTYTLTLKQCKPTRAMYIGKHASHMDCLGMVGTAHGSALRPELLD